MRWRLLTLLLLVAGPARAENGLDHALNLFKQGDFVAAADAAEILGTADGDALAARALLAEGAYRARGEVAETLLDRALADSAAALEKDPYHFEALLQRVIALGYDARRMGIWRAHDAGVGKQTKKLIDRALSVDDRQPWGWVVLGGWNAEVLADGGLFGRLLYGVSEDAAIESYEKAVAIAPDDPVLRVEFARALLRLGIRSHGDDARQQLETASTLPARNAFEALLKEQGAELLAALKTDNRKEIKRVFRATDPYRSE